jgi:hypothetical protein
MHRTKNVLKTTSPARPSRTNAITYTRIDAQTLGIPEDWGVAGERRQGRLGVPNQEPLLMPYLVVGCQLQPEVLPNKMFQICRMTPPATNNGFEPM